MDFSNDFTVYCEGISGKRNNVAGTVQIKLGNIIFVGSKEETLLTVKHGISQKIDIKTAVFKIGSDNSFYNLKALVSRHD